MYGVPQKYVLKLAQGGVARVIAYRLEVHVDAGPRDAHARIEEVLRLLQHVGACLRDGYLAAFFLGFLRADLASTGAAQDVGVRVRVVPDVIRINPRSIAFEQHVVAVFVCADRDNARDEIGDVQRIAHAGHIFAVLNPHATVEARVLDEEHVEVVPHQLQAVPGGIAALRVEHRLYGGHETPVQFRLRVGRIGVAAELVGGLAVREDEVEGRSGCGLVLLMHVGDVAREVVEDVPRLYGDALKLAGHALDAEKLVAHRVAGERLFDTIGRASNRSRGLACLFEDGVFAVHLAVGVDDFRDCSPAVMPDLLDFRPLIDVAELLRQSFVGVQYAVGGGLPVSVLFDAPMRHLRHSLVALDDCRSVAHRNREAQDSADFERLVFPAVIQRVEHLDAALSVRALRICAAFGHKRADKADGGEVRRVFGIDINHRSLNLGSMAIPVTFVMDRILEPGISTGQSPTTVVAGLRLVLPMYTLCDQQSMTAAVLSTMTVDTPDERVKVIVIGFVLPEIVMRGIAGAL